MDETPKNYKEEILLLYNVTITDIVFFKTQQLMVTNYVVLINSALLAIAYTLLKSLTILQVSILITLTWISCIAGIIFIILLQFSIDGRRIRLKNCRETFGKKFNDAWNINKKKESIFLFFGLIMMLSACVVTWLILDKIFK